MKILFILLFCAFMDDISVSYTPKSNHKEIPYGRLKWTDFKVKNVTDNTAAESVTSIGYIYDGYSTVTVFCNFDKEESFVKSKIKNDHILNHEQRHFDLTYIFAIRFISELKQQPVLNESVVEQIYNSNIVEKDRVQDMYDRQTKHSEDINMQLIWDKKIDNLLINL